MPDIEHLSHLNVKQTEMCSKDINDFELKKLH